MLCDEVTSAVDAETEAGIVEALKSINSRRTCVMVAHRLASIAHADRILVMRNGEIVEQGTHSELLKRGGRPGDLAGSGFYAKMWHMQHSEPGAPVPALPLVDQKESGFVTAK
jgi:ATP-binding cassette subfamily B protein